MATSTVLLVEDDENHAELIRRHLGGHRVRFDLIHVTDGEEAIDYLLRKGNFQGLDASPAPQVILLDLRLPRIDGLEVLRFIKTEETLRLIPVVIISSSAAEKDVRDSYRLNANGYVVKPLDFKEFRSLMKELGIYWLDWNQSASLASPKPGQSPLQ